MWSCGNFINSSSAASGAALGDPDGADFIGMMWSIPPGVFRLGLHRILFLRSEEQRLLTYIKQMKLAEEGIDAGYGYYGNSYLANELSAKCL